MGGFVASGSSSTRDGVVSFDLECIKNQLSASEGILDRVATCEVTNHGLERVTKWFVGSALPGSRSARDPGMKSDGPSPLGQTHFTRAQLLQGAAGAAVAAVMPLQPAYAESSMETRKQAYSRYVPRIERGRDFWAVGVRKQIQKGDWAAILKDLESPKGKISAIYSPMQLWAASFSPKEPSQKSIAMVAMIKELQKAASFLEIAALGKEKDSGFLGAFGNKRTIDESKRKLLAEQAYKKGVIAINKYIEISNDELGLSFDKMDLIDVD